MLTLSKPQVDQLAIDLDYSLSLPFLLFILFSFVTHWLWLSVYHPLEPSGLSHGQKFRVKQQWPIEADRENISRCLNVIT